MKIEIHLITNKWLLCLFLIILSNNLLNAQCVTGDASQDFCSIDNPTLNNIVATGISITWYDAATGGNLLDNSSALTNGTTYYAQEEDASCIDPTRLAVTTNIYGAPPSGTNVFVGKCAIDNPTIGDLSAAGTNIEWYDAQTGGTLLSTSHALVDNTTYWVQQTENGCTSLRLPTLVTIVDPPPPSVETDQFFCELPAPTVAELQPSGADINWYESLSSTTPLKDTDLLINGNSYFASQNSFPCEGTTRVQVNVTIDPVPNAGTDGSLQICEVDTAPQNLFTQLGGTPDITGTWSGPSTLTGGHLGTFNPTTNTVGDYTYTVSSPNNGCPDETATVSVTIIVVPPPTIAEPTQTFCSEDFLPTGPTVADLLPSGVLWYDTVDGTTALNPTDLLVDGQQYWSTDIDATSGCESPKSDSVTVSLIDPPPPTIAEPTQTFCSEDFLPDAPTVADLLPSGVLWYDAVDGTTPLNDTDLLIDGQQYWATDTDTTSGCESPKSAAVTVNIVSPLPPTITEPTQTFCSEDFLPDGPTVADLMPSGVVWYDAVDGTTPLNDTDLLVDGQQYWATTLDITSGCESPKSASITVSIASPPPPTISEPTQTFCSEDFLPGAPTVVDLLPAGSIWYDTVDGTTPLNPTDLLVDGQQYWATNTDTTSGCESPKSDSVTVNIVSPLPPTISEPTQTFCSEDFLPDGPTVADLMPSGVIWYDAVDGTTPLSDTDLLVDGQQYWATNTDATSGCESPKSSAVTVNIITVAPPTITEPTQTFCSEDFLPDGPTVAELLPTGVNWYDAVDGTTPLNSSDLLIDGQQYWSTNTDVTSGCESPKSDSVTVSIINVTPPTITETTQTFCSEDYISTDPTVADLLPTGVIWYDAVDGTTPLNPSDLLVDGQQYWATDIETTSGCESPKSESVTVNLVDPPPPTVTDTNQLFCIADNPTVADLAATGGTINWYDNEADTTPLGATEALQDGEDYWASSTDHTSGCESLNKVQVFVILNDIVPPTTSEDTQTFCASDMPTIADLNVNESSIVWYDSQDATSALSETTTLVDGEDYWAAQFDSTIGCESSVRLPIAVVLTDPGTPSIDGENTIFCEIDNPNPTLNDLHQNLNTNGGTITWYDTYPNGTILNLSELLVDGETYFASETDSNGCSSVTPLAATVTFDCPPEEFDVEIYDGFSPNGDGRNETFAIKDVNILYPDYRIEIFNRWGNSVFKGSGTNFWNGELDGNGKALPAGVYYFILHFNKDNRKPEQHSLYLSR